MDDREEYEERNTTALFPLVDSSQQNEIILCWEFVPKVGRRISPPEPHKPCEMSLQTA